MARLLVAGLIFSLAAAALGAQQLYQSNQLGMKMAPLAAGLAHEPQWVLSVERHGDTEIRTLLDHGTKVTRWEDTLAGGRVVSERIFQKGRLSSITDFRNGRPSRQAEYSDGKTELVRVYTYAGGLLRSIAVSDGEGKLQYRDLYSEGSGGRLRRAVREYPGGKRSVLSLNFSGDHLVSEWLGSDGRGALLRYSDGALVAREDWSGTKLDQTEAMRNGGSGRSTVTTDFQSGTVTTKRYDGKGRILSEEVTKQGTEVRTVSYTYVDGKIASTVTKEPGRREEVRYQYRAGGELAKSETTVNREVVKVTHYTGKENYSEDLYSGGQVVLRVYFEKGKKVKQVSVGGSNQGAAGG